MSITCQIHVHSSSQRITNLGSRASEIGPEHDHPWGGVGELLAAGLEAVLEELDVTATAVTALLVLDFVLNNERLGLEVDGLGEGGRDGVVGSLALRYETLVAVDDRNGGVLDLPFADIAEGFAADRGLLGRL